MRRVALPLRRGRLSALFGGQQSIAAAAILVAAGYLLSRVLGVVRTAAIARAFGTESDLAAYWVAFRLPDLIFQLVAGATLASAFIPAFTNVATNEGERAAWRLASSVINLVLLATIAVAILGAILAPVVVPLLAPGLGEDTGREAELQDLAVELTRWMLISSVLFSVSGMIMGVLNARRHFLAPALAPAVYNLSIIVAAVALTGPFGVHGLVVGVIAGAALHLAVQLPALVRAGMRYSPIAEWTDRRVREVFRLMVPRTIGLAAAQANFFITTIFFASFIGDEAISALTYAWLLMTLPLALFGMAIGTAVFPEMAESAARADAERLREMVARALRLILYLTIPASVGLILLGRPIIALLLQRGEFDAADAELTAAALTFFSVGLFAHGAIEILARGFYAISNTSTPMRMALLSMAVNAVLSLAFVGPFEVDGLAVALSVATTIEAALLYVTLRREFGDLDEREAIVSLRRTLVGTALLAEVVLFFVLGFNLDDPGVGAFLGVVCAIGLGAVSFFLATWLLRSEEADLLLRRGLAFLRSRRGAEPR
ncbi:MAG TPA: murein biosynthesis integral membrane protein MurJ [Dehalococcoidia bacterium]|nr:murein biosynthesis integral membrane protein MurJ [Dehalococcoidia bacterium]